MDIFPAFERIGHQFFLDADRFSGRFRTVDIFAPDSSLSELHRSQDVVTSTMFLHSFDWDTQLIACKKMLGLARGTGSWLMGGLSASLIAGEHWLKPPFVAEGAKKNVYRHDCDSFRRMWECAGNDLHMKLDIFTEYESRDTEVKRATELGGRNFFTGFEVKLLWYRVEVIRVMTGAADNL